MDRFLIHLVTWFVTGPSKNPDHLSLVRCVHKFLHMCTPYSMPECEPLSNLPRTAMFDLIWTQRFFHVWTKTCSVLSFANTHWPRAFFSHPTRHCGSISTSSWLPFSPNMSFDRFTRWLMAIADVSSEKVSKAILYHWVFIFGVPSTVTTDRDIQFQSKLLTNFFHSARI